ncbi:MAG TPA: N-carbamoylputrescine amidase [Firmicutes bacterium]|nr:N-carbamoylputrescine amidase [Bacillota bacterium]
MRQIKVAAVQMKCGPHREENIDRAVELVRQATDQGANLVLLPELFETVYFCQIKNPEFFAYATSLEENQAVRRFSSLAKELHCVLPISFFEKREGRYFNSVAIIDANGDILGVYRKTHIPDGPGYEEKFYFQPGDTGFRVWDTRYARIGVGICWDQWFPEAASSMALLGAEVLLYPTAIGSEPDFPEIDSKNHWQICMQGHAGANIMPVVAANRIGLEEVCSARLTFYGSSFITNEIGEKIAEADRDYEGVLLAELDLEKIEAYREYWGVFKDRRPEMYTGLSTSLKSSGS